MRLCQVSAPYVRAGLILRQKKRQVRPQLLNFLPLVVFRVAVGVGLEQRAPLGRRVATSTFLTLLFPPFGTTLLPQPRAVALEVTVGLALVTSISTRRSHRHRCSTPRYWRCRRLPRLLVDEVVCSKPREQLVVEGVSQLIDLILDELEPRREGIKKQVRVGLVEDLLPHVLQTEQEIVHGGDEASGIVAYFHFILVELLPRRTPSFLGVAVETVLQGLSCCRSISRGADCFPRVSFYCTVC